MSESVLKRTKVRNRAEKGLPQYGHSVGSIGGNRTIALFILESHIRVKKKIHRRELIPRINCAIVPISRFNPLQDLQSRISPRTIFRTITPSVFKSGEVQKKSLTPVSSSCNVRSRV